MQLWFCKIYQVALNRFWLKPEFSLVAFPPQTPTPDGKKTFYSKEKLRDGCMLSPSIPYFHVPLRKLRNSEVLEEWSLEHLGVVALWKDTVYYLSIFTTERTVIWQCQFLLHEIWSCQYFIEAAQPCKELDLLRHW